MNAPFAVAKGPGFAPLCTPLFALKESRFLAARIYLYISSPAHAYRTCRALSFGNGPTSIAYLYMYSLTLRTRRFELARRRLMGIGLHRLEVSEHTNYVPTGNCTHQMAIMHNGELLDTLLG